MAPGVGAAPAPPDPIGYTSFGGTPIPAPAAAGGGGAGAGPGSGPPPTPLHVATYFPETLIMFWFCQLLLALHHLHSRKIMHRGGWGAWAEGWDGGDRVSES